MREPSWWRDAAGYEIYVPSFADSDGDGWGDLPGIVERLPYLDALGVNLLWLTPIHPSPFADHGYDVADHLGVDPRFGTLEDVDRLVEAAGRREMRVLLDLVVNHTSDRHPWFRDALSGPGAEHRDYYVWRDPGPDGGPPNNWVSAFGGSAWGFDEASGQYFLHLFAPEQPDLNWADPRVANEVDTVLRFWLDRGVAGFRVDVAHSMAKHPDLLDNPRLDPPPKPPGGRPGKPREWDSFDHRHDLSRPEGLDIHRRWRRITSPRDALLLGEVNLREPEPLARYAGADGLDAVFAFPMAETEWDPPALIETVRALADASEGMVWAHGSHDRSRPVTRFGGGETGRRRALTLATLTIGLPAIPLLFQGEELGLDDAEIAPGAAQDPLARLTPGAFARDVVRTPMPWAPGPALGFTTAASAWMPLGDRTGADTVETQERSATSPLALYRALLGVRRRFEDLRRGEGPHWLDLPEPLAGYRRGDCAVIANLGPEPATPALPPGDWRMEFSTSGVFDGALPGEHAVVLAAS
jgi:alpha-glucosidase